MQESPEKLEESIDPFKPVADKIFAYLSDLIYRPSAASLDINDLPPSFGNVVKGLQYLNETISETRIFAKELSKGNLFGTPPSQTNEIAASLKSLHASLRHLTWQAQQVAKGNYSQRVDFMGDFSIAFNNMIEQLEERQQISLDEKTRLEMYVQLILANSPNPIMLFDKHGQLVYASSSCFRDLDVFGLDEVIGKDIKQLLDPIVSEETVKKINQLYKTAVVENRTMEIEQEVDFKNAYRHFRMQITPMLDTNSVFRGVMVLLIDITESVKAHRESEYARELAEQSSRAKTIFLAKMSHEIRTPMNAIIGMTELALREDIPPAAQEHIRTIKQASANLLSIINDILDFSKIETGKLELIQEHYSVASLINDVINIIKMRVIDSQIRFVVYSDNNIPSILLGDEARIRQVLLNILNNAIKYTKEGFVSFKITGETIDEDTINIIFEVMDSGIGIRQEDISGLFTEFTQFDMAKSPYKEGTGLGLAITRSIVEVMQGNINVESEFGKGSVFTVRIPQKFHTTEKLAKVVNPDKISVLVYERREMYANSILTAINSLGAKCDTVFTDSDFDEMIENNEYSFIFVSSGLFNGIREKLFMCAKGAKVVLLAGFGETVSDSSLSIITMPTHSIPIANILNGVADRFIYSQDNESIVRFTAPTARVLVVDDIITNLKVTEGLLLPYEMKVDLCKNGMTAIEMVRDTHYDMVFMDHMMPEMDGIEATAHIRALGDEGSYYKTMPIIALTANAVSGTREMFYENSFNDFLPKPIDTIQLNAVLERWLPKEKQESPKAKTRAYSTADVYQANESIKIDGLDTKRGLSIVRGSFEKYVKMLTVFYKDAVEKIGEIRLCLERADLPLYTINVHALKGACANIGADRLSEAAKSLEMAGRGGDLNYIHGNNEDFLIDFEVFLNKVNEVIIKNEAENLKGSIDMEFLMTWLVVLKNALCAFDSVMIKKAAGELEKFTYEEEPGAIVESILNNVLIGGYDEAITLIDSLL